MGRLIVLQFDDKKDVELFLNQHNDVGSEGVVVGEYYLPASNVYCRCEPQKRLHTNNWKRHSKLGVFVCRKCNKPSRHWRTGVMARLKEALGNNLLDQKKKV